MTPPPHSNVNRLLLVEDGSGDARAVEIYLRDSAPEAYEITVVTRLKTAIAHLEHGSTDVVLLDLGLPDSSGFKTLTRICAVASKTPVIVLTGLDDEGLAMQCIEAGAQDYLCKSNMNAHTLRRSLGYALGRVREAQMHALQSMLMECRALSSQQATTQVTRTLTGGRPIRDERPELYSELQATYRNLLDTFSLSN